MMLRGSRRRRGAVMVEYVLLVAGVALVSAAAVSLFGHKVADMIGVMAAVLPGAHGGDNGPIISGRIIETTEASVGGEPIGLDFARVIEEQGVRRLGNELAGPAHAADVRNLVVEPDPEE